MHLRYLLFLFITFLLSNSICSAVFALGPNSIYLINPDTVNRNFIAPQVETDTSALKFAIDSNKNGTLSPDSIQNSESLLNTSVDTIKTDYPLKSPIYSNAEDSLLYSLDGKMVFLFGNAVVKYENMELSAAYIEYNMENNVVFAIGKADSTGTIIGKPVFKDGQQVYRMEQMHYNFDTKRAKIVGVITEEAGGFLHSQHTKLMENNSINISGGKFTTCDLDHPHFYIGITKGKVIPGDKLIIGPAYLVIEDVPFPIGLPFGFFPNKKGQSSGIIIPEMGEEQNRGFFMKEGGFYFGNNEYFDLKLTTDIYSKGSWAFNARSTYRKRYRYSGNFSFSISENILGDKGQDDYSKSQSYWLRWNHSQDPKASPNSTFQASVNLGSPNHNRYNARSVDAFLTNSMSSSISYSKVWPGTPFSMSSTMSHNQNNIDSTITLGLPKVSFNMSRIYPLKRKRRIGAPAWYENIGLSLSSRVDNSISTTTDKLFTEESLDKFKNGVQHSVPISTSFNLLKFIVVSPNVNYSENWYTRTIAKRWDPDSMYTQAGDTLYGRVVTDIVPGFARAWQYNTGVSMSTKVYGMFNFRANSAVQAIRHIMTPSVGFSYRPDFSQEFYGFYKQVYTPYDTLQYSIFEQSLFGGPGSGKSGMINLSLGNNLEMKVRSSKDTTANFKKIKILESLSLNTSYNLLADSMNWSPVSANARTTLFEMVNINLSGTLNPYAIDSLGRIYNQYMYKTNGIPFRLTNARASVGFSLSGGKGSSDGGANQGGPLRSGEKFGADPNNPNFGEAIGTGYNDIDYVDFSVPWTLRLDYSFSYSKQSIIKSITQSMSFSGDISLTPKWKVGFTSGYDIKNKKLTTTSLNFYRDLHCWEMRLSVVPIGYMKSFSFYINVKSPTLKDLKYTKSQNYLDNF